MRLDPFCGAVPVFRAKRADRVRILARDGSGMVLIARRLEGGKLAWPAVREGVMRLSPGRLAALFEGLDWRRVHVRRPPRIEVEAWPAAKRLGTLARPSRRMGP